MTGANPGKAGGGALGSMAPGLVTRALVLQGDGAAVAHWTGAPWDWRHEDDGSPQMVRMAHVLAQGAGGDLCLGLCWADALRSQGQAVEILAFPTRLLLRLDDAAGQRRIIDPCRGGASMTPPDLRALQQDHVGAAMGWQPALFEPQSDDAILLRLLAEAKVRCLRQGDVALALVMVDGALHLAPERAKLWREAGLMRLRQGDLAGAVAALEQFVSRTDNVPARGRASQLLAQIRVRMP